MHLPQYTELMKAQFGLWVIEVWVGSQAHVLARSFKAGPVSPSPSPSRPDPPKWKTTFVGLGLVSKNRTHVLLPLESNGWRLSLSKYYIFTIERRPGGGSISQTAMFQKHIRTQRQRVVSDSISPIPCCCSLGFIHLYTHHLVRDYRGRTVFLRANFY